MSRISWVECPQEGGTEKQALQEENSASLLLLG